MKVLLSVLAIFLVVHIASSQGEYLQRGENGYGLDVSMAMGKNAYGLGASAAISMSGTVDLGLSYAFILAKVKSTNVDQISKAFSPFANVHFVKQSKLFPLSLSGSVLYQIQYFYSDSHEQIRTVSLWSYGVSIFSGFNILETSIVQPSISFITTNEISGGGSVDPGTNIQTTEIAISFILRSNTRRYVVRPSIALTDNDITYSFGFAFLGLFSN